MSSPTTRPSTRASRSTGAGLALAREDIVRPYIERGELVSVLEEFSTPFPGFYLYYPARRQPSPALRALINYLLELRQAR